MKPKVFIQDRNNVLTIVRNCLQSTVDLVVNPREADLFLLWQDVRGELAKLADIAVNSLKKPVFVVQHGLGATRDYDSPNKFPLLATKFLAWGPSDKERMDRLGYRDRTRIVGCPLTPFFGHRMPHDGKRLTFVPVVMDKEEPENILTYLKLKEWETIHAMNEIYKKLPQLQECWATQNITFPNQVEANKYLSSNGNLEGVLHNKEILPSIPHTEVYNRHVVVKLIGLHDRLKYSSPALITNQIDVDAVPKTAMLIRTSDVVVVLEEGTLPALATMINVPVIHVDIYKYKMYAGVSYSNVERLHFKSFYKTTTLNDLPDIIEYVLGKEKSFGERLKIDDCNYFLGMEHGNPTDNILNVIYTHFGMPLIPATIDSVPTVNPNTLVLA